MQVIHWRYDSAGDVTYLRLGHAEEQLVCAGDSLFPFSGVHHQHEVFLTPTKCDDASVSIPEIRYYVSSCVSR